MTETAELKVLKCEDILGKIEGSVVESTEGLPATSKKSKKRNRKKPESAEKPIENIRGPPKSGRFWKTEKKRFRTMVKTPGLATKSLEQKLALRAQLKDIKEKSRAIINERKNEKEAKKQRRRDNLKRAEENRKKAEIVQKITNSAKLKRMKKKQLKNIEKRDTTTTT